jgi:hypothetical protein
MLLFLLACTSSTSTTSAAAGERHDLTTPRVVAVGDLHGDPDAAQATLRLAGLTDAAGRWTGGTATLVQTGDVTDRGPDSRGVIALLRRLQEEARAVGGRVVPLLGNHEVMNLRGDWRYVSPADVEGYGGPEARRAAFGPDGPDGAWLRAQDAVARVGDTVYAHGGVDARWASLGVEALNVAVRAAIAAERDDPVLGPDGPLWNRSFLLADAPAACDELTRALAQLGAARMVVGHTTQRSGRIASRCDGRLRGIDTGISAGYGGHVAALEVQGAAVRELYPPTAAGAAAP